MKLNRWRGSAGHALAVLLALVLASFAFLYRFNALGGALGGFDNDEFQMLTRVDLILAGEQPLRDFADGEMRGVWPSLSYEVPAVVQRIWGRNLLVHAYLTLTVLSVCAGIVFVFARRLSGSWVCALLAAGVVIVSGPKAYNYTKVVTLTVAAVALYGFVRAPTIVRLGALAAWTVVGALFRHDYAVYVGVAVLVAVVLVEPRPWRVPVRRSATYAALCLVFALPSVIWVTYYIGIGRYFGILSAAVDAEGGTRSLEHWPVIDFGAPFESDGLVAFNYYVFWAIPFGAGLLALWQILRSRPARPMMSGDLGFGLVLVAMTLVVNHFFLRSNLQARFGDAVVPVVLLASWIAGSSLASPIGRGAARAVPIALLALMFGAFFRFNSVAHEFETGGLTVSLEQTRLRFREVTETLRALPAADMHVTEGPLAASRYLSLCTMPNDRVLMGIYADEIPYFASRLIAAGQGYFGLGFLRKETDQRLALERLARQSVPVVLTAFDYDREIAMNYPLIARYISARYREAGVITTAGQPYLRVFVDIMRTPASVDSVSGFPCFR